MTEQRKKEIIDMANERGDFLMLEDGDWYYFPSSTGACSAALLRLLADELDRRNNE